MLTKTEKLIALDAEFDSPRNRIDATMKLAEYLSRRGEIEAQPEAAPTPAPRPARLSEKQLAMVGRVIGRAVREHIAGKMTSLQEDVRQLQARLAVTEQRVSELESKPHMKYRGVWSAEEQFNEADLVTDSGSMWYCRRSTRGRPGASDDWQLCVKHGRDLR
jgi:hypothetical protein